MADVRVPDLGESIVEATIGAWLKNVGDSVAEGEAVAELETDKVNVEVISESAGVLQSTAFEVGDTVTPGDTIAVVGEGSGEGGSAADEAPAPAAASSEANAAETQERKPADAPTSQPSAPVAAKQQTDTGNRSQDTGSNEGVGSGLPPRATPAVRRLAMEQGVSIEQLQGSGGHGRITEGDVRRQVNPPSQAAAPSTGQAKTTDGASHSTPAAQENPAKPEERVRMSRRRQTIAKRLVEVQHTAAMLTTFNEVDMTNILDIRRRRKDAFKDKNGVGLGFMSFFTKAVVGALKTMPRLNAEIQGDEMVLKQYYDIGIAVSTESGLVVPVVRDADKLNFAEIEGSIADLAKKARNNQLGLGDLQGGTFTITNGGVFGSLLSTPILNAPQVGILGMHKIQERPVAVDGKVEIRPMMYLALSYDHRIVDGSEAVQFLVKVKELLEDPEQLLLEG